MLGRRKTNFSYLTIVLSMKLVLFFQDSCRDTNFTVCCTVRPVHSITFVNSTFTASSSRSSWFNFLVLNKGRHNLQSCCHSFSNVSYPIISVAAKMSIPPTTDTTFGTSPRNAMPKTYMPTAVQCYELTHLSPRYRTHNPKTSSIAHRILTPLPPQQCPCSMPT